MDIGNLLFSFRGRLNRGKYWLAVLIWIGLYIVIGGIAGWVMASGNILLGAILLAVVFIPGTISVIAIGIRRLHDRDKSGAWLLLFYLVPSILDGFGREIGGAGMILSLAGFAISVWAFVELGCLRGTVGPNQFGPDPLAGMLQQPA